MVSPDPDLFPPELEELVTEIARDPRSSFLRTERPPRPTALFDPPDPLSPRTPGLTSAEREILTVYREELTALLLQRWLTEVTERPAKGSWIFAGSAADGRVSRAEPPHSVRELVELGRRELPGADLAEGLLDPALVLSPDQRSNLVTWAVRLSPDTRGKIYLASDYNLTGQRRSAIAVVGRLLAIEWRAELRPYLWGILAAAHGDDWNPRDLVRWYRKAAQGPKPGADALLVWLLVAANTGDSRCAREAAEIVDGLIAPDDPFLVLHVDNQRRTRSEGRWAPNPRRRADLDALLGAVGPASRRALHALEP